MSAKFYTANGLTAPTDMSGVLQTGLDTPIMSVTDGLTNTVLVLESAGRPEYFLYGKDQGQSLASGSDGYGWADPDMNFKPKGIVKNATLANPDPGNGGPCFINCTNNSEIYSFHSVGVNATMGDGSVRLITKNVAAKALAALITARGAEVNSD
jgi:hypothetical protein